MISHAHSALLDKREKVILAMAKMPGGVKRNEAYSLYPGLFTRPSQFTNYMNGLIIRHPDLNKKTIKGRQTIYYIQHDPYLELSELWDRHTVDVHNAA